MAGAGSTVAVSTQGVITVTFTRPMDPAQTGRRGHFSLVLVRNNQDQPVGSTAAMTSTYAEPASVPTLTLTAVGRACLPPEGSYRLTSNPARLRDAAFNVLSPGADVSFQTLMSPNGPNVMASDPSAAPVSRVTFGANAWGSGAAGLAINADPVNQPLSPVNLGALIDKADLGRDQQYPGHGAPLWCWQEFALYNAQGPADRREPGPARPPQHALQRRQRRRDRRRVRGGPGPHGRRWPSIGWTRTRGTGCPSPGRAWWTP